MSLMPEIDASAHQSKADARGGESNERRRGGLPRARRLPAKKVHFISRAIICVVVIGSMGGLFWTPPNGWWYAADLLLRTWLIFIGTVMAHEGSHGHLGRTRAANLWWGRIALVPSMVPFANFRKTHLRHHRYTNEKSADPDYYIKPGREWEIPFRALAMPHQWFFWLRRRGELDLQHVREIILNYFGIAVCFLPVLLVAGGARLFWGMVPVLVMVSVLLWYPFAYLTHEGFSEGSESARSHDYFGRFAFWFSFGLSMHRVHHMRPHYAWIDLLQFVRPAPPGRWSWLPRRDIRHEREEGPSVAIGTAEHNRSSVLANGPGDAPA